MNSATQKVLRIVLASASLAAGSVYAADPPAAIQRR